MSHQTASAVPSVTLSNGVKMPMVGLGTWASEPAEIDRAVRAALDVGYRHIDTAWMYENEEAIGATLKAYEKEKGLKREELFITTKLWTTFNREENVEKGLRDSLKKLQLDYVDLFLVHMPVAYTHDNSGKLDMEVTVLDTWRGMEHVYEKGLAKAIGVSNFSCSQIERIMAVAKVPIHNQQVELHLYFPQWEMQKCCDKYNISLCAYSPLGSPGRYSFQPAPPRPPIHWPKMPEPMDNEVVKSIATKHGKTPSQVVLRHLIQRNIIVIPKSTNPQRIKENFQLFDFELSADEMEMLNAVPSGQRRLPQDFLANHPEDPFPNER